MLDGLRADAAAAQETVDDLTADVARWDDDAYVEAQARERLKYVYPGETAFSVIDPETVEGEAATEEATGEGDASHPADTWYDALWKSVEEAGGAGADATGEGAN